MPPTQTAASPKLPRWKVIHDLLVKELPGFAYGSSFYTLDQICEKYGVSLITARRVLDELASQGLVEKIRKRGTIARSINQKLAVYVVQPSFARADYSTFNVIIQRQLAGVEQYARDHQIRLEMLNDSHLSSIFFQDDERVGFILPQLTVPATIEFLRQKRWPFVMLDPLTDWRGLPHARVNRRSVGQVAANHLLQLGHRRIAYVLGALSDRHFRDRLMGYKTALSQAGIRFDWDLVKETFLPEHAETAMHMLMSLKHPPTAIVTGDDGRAIQILEICQRLGIKVPDQLSLLSYPGFPVSALTRPPLSVLDARYEEVGRQAIQLLLQQIFQGAEPSKQALLVEPQLVERASTAKGPHSA